ncbi:hypothetical protein [Chryseobacterium sp.]|uniref:hypothetical protein n=1 Tax=Chryseobacterium sp. TaxID=1871047 RepID=UPI00289B3EB0|nr:hypothetical protein [Chryseobacterium sp.]
MKIKLLILFSFIAFINIHAQEYIFGKITYEEKHELADVNVINIRTDERVLSNRDGHFMISGRAGDILRFVKKGFDRFQWKVAPEDTKSSININMVQSAILIEEVEIKKGLTGDLKLDSKALAQSKKVEKLKSDLSRYISQKSDPRILAAKPGEFVQPKGQGFSIGKVKNKWDDLDLANYIVSALGTQYFTDLQIEQPFINHFVNYILQTGFERKNILKYGYMSDADLMRFQRTVLNRITTYKAPPKQK